MATDQGPSLSSTMEALMMQSDAESLYSADSAESSPGSDGFTEALGPLKTSKPKEIGAGEYKCEVQTLYEGPPKCQCCKNWVEEYPDDLRTAIEEQPAVKLKALIVRMRKNHGDGKPLVLDSIVVQSPSLKETLGKVFEGYDGITASLRKLVFKSPFRPFYYRWQRFTEIMERQKQDDPTAAAFSQLLYNLLHAELHDILAEAKDLVEHRVITYPLLWTLFEPGSLIVKNDKGETRFFIVDSFSYTDRGCAVITAKFIDRDSVRFGYASECLAIRSFDGTNGITELYGFPAKFHPFKEEAEADAIRRGAKFQKLGGFHYMAHSGLVQHRSGLDSVERNVDGRIVVDAASYFRANPSLQPSLAPLKGDSIVPKLHIADDQHLRSRSPVYRCGTGRMNEMDFERRIRERKLESGELPLSTKQETETEHDLSEDQLLLCHTYIRGYSLKLKIWVEFKVEDVYDIAWNDTAFPNLLLPKGFKNLILSFVEGQTANKVAFDDVIEGKGQGIIMMLVGNPGTGKTLTAEAVADKIRKPLYVLSAGELGQNASNVEKRLSEVLELTEKWGAVLLFDECDVFIQERSTRDLAHNEIVAVFLRLLEYYRGILFMTSNRANTIDRAFHSRIHLTLHYPDLEPAAKDHIWRHFSRRSKLESRLTDEDIAHLARLPLNGRQIKNVVKISTLLAAQEDTALSMDQIRAVLQATMEGGEGLEV